MRHREPDLQAILDKFIKGYSDPLMHNHLNFLAFIVAELQPQNVLEIGTGTGMAARMMVQLMPREGSLVTVITTNQEPTELAPWRGNKRLDVVGMCETIGVLDPVDILFLNDVPDPALEWETWCENVVNGGVVLVDAVQTRAAEWWRVLPYNKVDTALHGAEGFGMFINS